MVIQNFQKTWLILIYGPATNAGLILETKIRRFLIIQTVFQIPGCGKEWEHRDNQMWGEYSHKYITGGPQKMILFIALIMI